MAQKWSFRITPARIILILMVLVTLALAVFRLITGLGVSTNLNDIWPWGLWIGFDLTIVALAGAGYSMCLITHVLHIKKFKPVSRRALLLSLLGYIFVLLTLILEIGRWDNCYRPLISWGIHSPMFEVYVCIAFYFMIQLVEFFEIFTEKLFRKLNPWVKITLPVVFILGALLPFGHQASLGAIYLPMAGRLHPLWWSQAMPWFFLITSFYVGPAVVALETYWASKIYDTDFDTKVLGGLIKISGVLMAAYLVWKGLDLVSNDAFKHVFAGTFESNMFLLEMIVGVVLPMLIALSPMAYKKSGIVSFSLLAVVGVVLSRVNVVFTGMYEALGPGYSPNWIEWGISFGLLALTILVYMFIVENFKIYGMTKSEPYSENYVYKRRSEIQA